MNRGEAIALVSGAVLTGYLVVALLFARFWRDTHDRLFGMFAAAFTLLGVQRVALALSDDSEDRLAFYLVRLAAYVVILWAIADKNRSDRRPSRSSGERQPGAG